MSAVEQEQQGQQPPRQHAQVADQAAAPVIAAGTPRRVDVDAEAAAGAIHYVIGATDWIAPEPDNEKVRQVLVLDEEAEKRAQQRIAEWKAAREKDPQALPPSTASQLTDDSLVLFQQVSLLLHRYEPDTGAQWPDKHPDAVWLMGQEGVPGVLSVKRAMAIVKEVLGEDVAAGRV
jgi:hypothetical protein